MLLRKVKVFIATPRDVSRERELAETVIKRVNGEVSDALRMTLELVRWETHADPAMGRPQSHVTQLVDQCDIFLGVLWHRFGTPPGKTECGEHFASGTGEEFDRALKRWRKNGSRADSLPRIMIYFSDRRVKLSAIDTEQTARVAEFRKRFDAGGSHEGLTGSYRTLREFEVQVHQHLLHALIRLSGGLSSANLVLDFVDILPDGWYQLFAGSRIAKLMLMYSSTWRNTYLKNLREIVNAGGHLQVVLPSPTPKNPTIQWMAAKIQESSKTLMNRVQEAAADFKKLNTGKGSVEVRFTPLFYTHTYYLFENGGIVALYTYRPDRAPSGAIRVPTGNFYRQCVAEFDYVFRTAPATPKS